MKADASKLPEATAQRSAASPRVEQDPVRGRWAHTLQHSQRMVAQRRQLDAAFGDAVQRNVEPASPNLTGMPDSLKEGIESFSGMDMSEVRVHRNSSKPAQLNALAYAQGNDIHLAPGQERHLPHEAWHVVQQRQGRVRQTVQRAGVGVNDEVELEREADLIGARAVLQGANMASDSGLANGVSTGTGSDIAQLATEIRYTQQQITYWRGGAHTGPMTVGVAADALLDPADPKTGSRTGPAPTPSVYTNGNWPTLYQGHLLNANLGGQAIAANLFPVTPAFNGQHSSIIEDNVKAELLNLNAKRNDPTPVIAANYANRRLHYSVQVINNNLGGAFRPAHVGATIFRCSKEYTNNNNTPLGGTGADHTLSHGTLDVQVPPPPDTTLNERLSNLNWGPDDLPTYTLGIHPGPGHALNVRTVLDGFNNTVQNMFIAT